MQLSRLVAVVAAAGVFMATADAKDVNEPVVLHLQKREHGPNQHAFAIKVEERTHEEAADGEVPAEVNTEDDTGRGWKAPVVDPVPHHKHVDVEDTYERVESQDGGKQTTKLRSHLCRNGKCTPGLDDGSDFDWDAFNEDYGFIVINEGSTDDDDDGDDHHDDGNAAAHPHTHNTVDVTLASATDSDEDLKQIEDLEVVPQYYDQEATAKELERVSRAVANQLAATAISAGAEETETALIASSIAGLVVVAVGVLVAAFFRRRVSSFDDQTTLTELPEPQSVSVAHSNTTAPLEDEQVPSNIELASDSTASELPADEEGSFSITVVRDSNQASSAVV